MAIKAFLFDLDGVIVDTAIYHYKAWRKLANDCLGFDISEEFNENLKGVSREESINRILEHGNVTISDERKQELMTLKNDWYLDFIGEMNEGDILPGISDLFIELKQTEIKIGLGSVSKNAKYILNKIGMIDLFDVIIDGTKISKGKPDPEVFLNGALELDLQPTECIVFEDAVAGVQAGVSAGMKVVGVGEETILQQATIVFDSLKDISLSQILEKLGK